MDNTTPWYWERFNLFAGADDDARLAFFQCSEKKKYGKGNYIFMAGDEGKQIFLLESGIVKIFNLSPAGTQTVFWFCVPGDVFGAGGISGSRFQSVYAQTLEPTVVYFISRANFERVLKQHPQLAINMIRLMGGRLRLACESMVDIAEHKAEVRLARLLLRLALSYGKLSRDGIELTVHISQQELANMIGTSRQTVNEILQEFQQHGWIDFEGRTIFIVSPGDLQELVNEAG